MAAANPSPLPAVRLYLLGPFRLEREGQVIRLPTRKVEILLAFLVLHPESHLREKLAALFWGDTSDAQARASLRNALPSLRKQLGENVLWASRESIQLNPEWPLWVDVHELTALLNAGSESQGLQLAIDLYRGDLLADFYEDWVLVEREHFRAAYLKALLALIRLYRSRAEYALAITNARRLLDAEPSYEAAHQNLMFCYQALGDREAALRQFDSCRNVLWRELGVEPSAETTALYNQIKMAVSVAPDAGLTNLPIPLTSFIGRAKEIEELSQALTVTRLYTVTGPGGAGKTRLAIEVARAGLARFADGVWWVELAPLADPSFVLQAVARACGIHEVPAQPLLETLIAQLRSRQTLLVIDNCEHVLETVAELATQLLNACPRLQILTTSREGLNVAGEKLWPVSALTLTPSGLEPAEALRLFIERAAAVQPGFSLTETNAATIQQICEQLDGLPLAIELAAARVQVLSPAQIAARLDDRFNLLAGRQWGTLPHHQTLRAAIDWSYDLLEPDEQHLFRQLAIFAGGCTLTAIESVCATQSETANGILDLLARLINKSLVLIQVSDGEARYTLLETIRQYALEKLAEMDERESLRKRHLTWCLQFVDEAERWLMSAAQPAWLARLEAEHDNLRAALHGCLTHTEIKSGLQLAGALWPFWGYRNYMSEGRDWLAQLLARPEANQPELAALRAKALASAGVLAIWQSDYLAAGSLLQISLALWQALDNQPGIAFALHYLGWVANAFGQFAAARQHYEESLAIRRGLGDAGRWDVAESLANLGMLAFSEGDYAAARQFEEESLNIKQTLGETWGALFSIWHLGAALVALGDYATARNQIREGLTRARSLGEHLMVAYSLESAGWWVALAQPELLTMAPRLWGAAETIRLAIASPQPPQWRGHIARIMAGVQARLGQSAFTEAWTEGRTLKLEEAVSEALYILR